MSSSSQIEKRATSETSWDAVSVTVEGRTPNKSYRIKKLKSNNEAAPSKSFTENTQEEKICEAIISDFVRRFLDKYPRWNDRLHVMAENEYGVSKCVCSTLKPSLLPFPAIHDSVECSDYIAHFLEYEPLEDPIHPPRNMPSPSQVLKWGIGDCFDLSLVLASFLLGSGYDAYIVYGTAPKWICDRERSRAHASINSSDVQLQHSKNIAEMKSMIIEDNLIEGDDIHIFDTDIFCCSSRDMKESDKDKGSLHCWVLVKTNLRCPPGSTDYFIEPSTGCHYSISTSPYHDVYGVWNSSNYWVNTKRFDGENVCLAVDNGWEPVFFNKDKTNFLKNCHQDRMPLDPTFSWVDHLSISESMFAYKYPTEGRRVIFFDKRKVELFAEGVQKQGITKRITTFRDEDFLYPVECLEYFGETRKDSLCMRLKLQQEHCFFESFSPLNQYSMKEWIELSGERRLIRFYPKRRPDGLIFSNEIFGKEITYTYADRRDLLNERIVLLVSVDDARTKMKDRLVFPSGDGTQNAIVTKIIEKYELPTNHSLKKHQLSCRILCLREKRLEIQYFDVDGGILKGKTVQSKRRNQSITTNEDGDLIDHQRLNFAEKEIVTVVRNLHQETLDLIRARKRDEDTLRNDLSHDVEGGQVASRPKTLEVNQNLNKAKTGIDYLSPYLTSVQDIDNISTEEATRIREACMATMRERLVERANIIQNRLDEENKRLAFNQVSYQQNLDGDHQSENDFEKVCSEIVFRIKILERRILEHEDTALNKLKELECKLNDDPRLKAFSKI